MALSQNLSFRLKCAVNSNESLYFVGQIWFVLQIQTDIYAHLLVDSLLKMPFQKSIKKVI